MYFNEYVERDPKLKRLIALVKPLFSAKRFQQHNWEHIARGVKRAISIGETEGADMEIVLPAIIAHDYGHLFTKMGRRHEKIGGKRLAKLLRQLGYSDCETARICHCVETHKPPAVPQTLEAKVVYDADQLERCGFLGVIWNILATVEYGRSVKETIRTKNKYVKALKQGRAFLTDTGRKLGIDGYIKFLKFYEEVRKELDEGKNGVVYILE